MVGYMCGWLHVLLATCVVGYMCCWLHVWLTTCVVGYMCGRLHVWLDTCVVGYMCGGLQLGAVKHTSTTVLTINLRKFSSDSLKL